MKSLASRVHPVTVFLTLIVVGFAVFMVYQRKLQSPHAVVQIAPPIKRIPMATARGNASGPRLGAILKNSKDPAGMKIMAFQAPKGKPVLELLGCKEGDVLVNINGGPVDSETLKAAVQALREDAKPLTIVLYREGKKVELRHTELPEAMKHSRKREESK